MLQSLPQSVRYMKNGRGGQWWKLAKTNGQAHFGWKLIPHEYLLNQDYTSIEQLLKAQYEGKAGATQDFNQLRDVLHSPGQHVWITFEEGALWWCTVQDGIEVNAVGESTTAGNFWLACETRWTNRSLKGKLLAISDLPGTVTTTAGFKGTVCRPRAWQAILRIIMDEKDTDAIAAADARTVYVQAVTKIIQRLSPHDFEQLIDLILTRTGWLRISTLGRTREGIDVEARNLTADELAFVQVKSQANQKVLMDYVSRFNNRRDLYSRMIFAVHSPVGTLTAPSDSPVQIWTGEIVSQLAVRLGLGEWAESRLA